MFLKDKNIIFKIRRSKVTDYAALRHFHNGIYMLYRKSNRDCQFIRIEQLPCFIKILYAKTLSEQQRTGTTNPNRILFENGCNKLLYF